jgi:hypothetical protein
VLFSECCVCLAQEQVCEFSVRKKKKGAPGKQSGSSAFKKIAWANVELHKYCTKSGPQRLELMLYYKDEGEEHYGKGACLSLTLIIQPLMTDDSGNEVSQSASSLRGAEAAKSDLAEGHALLLQRGEKISQMQQDSEQLANDAGEYSKMAKQLAGGRSAVPVERRDRAAEVAARHDNSDFRAMMKDKKTGKKDSPSKSSSSGSKPQTANITTTSRVPVESVSDNEDDNIVGRRNNNIDTRVSGALNEDNILDVDLEQYLSSASISDSNNKDSGQNGKQNNRVKTVEGSSSATVGFGLPNNSSNNFREARDGTLGDDSSGDDEEPQQNGLGARLDPAHVIGKIKSNLTKGGHLLNEAAQKAKHDMINTGQNIVQGGKNTVNKGKQNFEKVSLALVDGVKNVAHTVGIGPGALSDDEDGTRQSDSSNHNYNSDPNMYANTMAARYGAEKENIERTFSEYANIEFPKAEIDANTTTEDLRVLEKLEAARLENITLREKAIQFEYQMAKYNFFVAENARLQGKCHS